MNEILDQFKTKKVLVIGDIMLDKYIFGNVARISPEAPVPVIEVEKENHVPGGAGNTAANVAVLGAKTYLTGLVGEDLQKSILLNLLKKSNINIDGVFVDKNRPTIQKIRVMSKNHQLIRIDYEKKDRLDNDFEKSILDYIKKMINKVKIVIISDYAKGVVTENIAKHTIALARERNIQVIVDPKPQNKRFYHNATIITPNLKEAYQMANSGEDEKIENIGSRLQEELNSKILITMGEKGISLFERGSSIVNIPTKAKEVFDVSGAGDTVIATLSLAIASGASAREAAIIANHAAGIKVGKLGTSTVTIEEIKKSLENDKSDIY